MKFEKLSLKQLVVLSYPHLTARDITDEFVADHTTTERGGMIIVSDRGHVVGRFPGNHVEGAFYAVKVRLPLTINEAEREALQDRIDWLEGY